MHEFKPYPQVDPQTQPSAQTKKKKRPSGRPELHYGEPFGPQYVYEILTKISSTLSTKVRVNCMLNLEGYISRLP